MADLTILTDEELTQLRIDVATEQERRSTLANAEQQVEQISAKYLDAAGRDPGSEWVQPTGAFDAYPMDYLVAHGGKMWRSTTPNNVWEPGVSGWREEVEEGSAPAEFVQPTGAHDAYNIGDRVTFEGQVYESTIDANVYSPSAYPAGWTLITA